MIREIKSFVSSYMTKGHERSIRAKKNIAFSLALKVINVAVQFLFVPLLLGYLNPVRYGIWITVGSVINWFYFFDIGLGNGLRNKLAEAFAKNENDIARIYISTAYAALTAIAIILYLIFLVADKFIRWEFIFNSPLALASELDTLMVVVFTFFAINFIVRLIGSILNADQKPSMNDLIYTTGNVISLLIIFGCTKISHESLILVGIVVGFSTFLPAAIATALFFQRSYRQYKPSVKFIDFKHLNHLSSLGIKFFIMQVASIVVFATNNFIIIQLFGPAQVIPYNTALTYFSAIQVVFSIILTPFWSAFTEAFAKNDLGWIKAKVRQLINLWLTCTIIVVIMILLSNPLFKIWVGNKVIMPFGLTCLIGLFIIMNAWSSIFSNFINGVGKIRLSLITASINAIINIPISIFFAKTLNLGVNGVVLGTCISLSIGVVLRPMQYWKIINHVDRGIWAQ